jgi:hypothetical protein
VLAWDHDISGMKPPSLSMLETLLLLAAGPVLAQNPNNMVGGSQFSPPLPAPPPSPSTAVPVVPTMGVASPQYSGPNYGYNNSPQAHPSFHKRVKHCLAEAAAGGFCPGDRDYYVRSCVNR